MIKLINSSIILIAIITPVLALSAAPKANSIVNKKAAILKKMHSKASKALVNAAQDKSYANFMTADKAKRHEHSQAINKVSLNVQKKFHVEEMCLIDANGPELARIVGRKVATDLSPDESGADFFKPGFETKPKKVFTSRLYLSPDANKWVIAYVSPIVVEGKNKAVLHYEHGLDVYQNALNKKLSGTDSFLVAIDNQGYLVSDSRGSIAVVKKGESEEMGDYFQKFELGGKSLDNIMASIKAGKKISDGNGKSYTGFMKKVGNWTLLAFSVA